MGVQLFKTALILMFALSVLVCVTGCADDGNGFSINIPTIEGPITEPGEPCEIAIESGRALSEDGYEKNEYFISGTAVSYQAANDLPDSGMWKVEPAESAAYKTRILVYRPIDPDSFNGTVIVEWMNVTSGVESAPEYRLMHTELLRRGYAWIGVSAQYIGVEGGDASHGLLLVSLPLKTVNPERYGSLIHPGDNYSYDIYSQVAYALRHPGSVDPMDGYDVQAIIAAGESQSAFRLTTYINGIHPYFKLYDGFFVHSRGGGAAPLYGEDIGDFSGALKIRTDLNEPVLILETETDLFGLGYYNARQDDTDTIRLWEMAGTAHADYYVAVAGATDDGTDPAVANLVEVSAPVPDSTCNKPINSGPQHFIAKAAIHQLNNWMRNGIAAPVADRLEIDADSGALARDEHGNALGGIRTPYVDVPIATLSGEGQSGGTMCFLFGVTELFGDTTLDTLYPDHETYVTAVENATDQAVQEGFLISEDGELIIAAAEESDIGN